MLGILIIIGVFISIGRTFYRLAKRHGKIGWIFGILGVASYYAGVYGVSILVYLLSGYVNFFDVFFEMGRYGITLITIPTGIITCISFYQILKRLWSKEREKMGLDDDILDAEVIRDEKF